MAIKQNKAVARKPRPRKSEPLWERGYFSHGYWKGRKKLGSVKLGPKADWDGIYRWEAGTHYGEAASLAAAKQAVEQVVAFGASQIGLFDDTELEASATALRKSTPRAS